MVVLELILASTLQDDVRRLIDDLDDVYEARIAAERALIRIGKPALKPLHELLSGRTSAQQEESATRVRRAILAELWKNLRAAPAKPQNCAPGPFEEDPARSRPLAGFFAGGRIEFRVSRVWCQHCAQCCFGESVIGLSTVDGEFFLVRDWSRFRSQDYGLRLESADRLARFLKPSKDEKEMLGVLAALMGELAIVRDASVKKEEGVSQVTVPFKGGWVRAEFGLDGTLRSLSVREPE
jgi:hypothetical protein